MAAIPSTTTNDPTVPSATFHRSPNVPLTTFIQFTAASLATLTLEFNKLKLPLDGLVNATRDSLCSHINALDVLSLKVSQIQSMAAVRHKQLSMHYPGPGINPSPPSSIAYSPHSFNSELTEHHPFRDLSSSFLDDSPRHSPPNMNDHWMHSLSKLDALASSIAVELALYRQFVNEDVTTILQTAIDHQSDQDIDHSSLSGELPYSLLNQPIIMNQDLNSLPMTWKPLIPDVFDHLNLGWPQCIHSRAGMLAIGTSRGAIAVFTLASMQLKHVMKPLGGTQLSPATSVDLSCSAHFLVSGHSSGILILWNLIKGTVVKRIDPLPNLNIHGKVGHLEGSRISHLSFVGDSNRRFVSVDELGVAFLHSVSLQLFESSTICRFFGSYSNRLNLTKFTTVFSVVSIYRYVAILTPFKLVILCTRPVRTVYRLLRMSTSAPEIGPMSTSGCLALLDNTLILTWSNWMRTIKLEITTEGDLLTHVLSDLTLPNSATVVRQVDQRYLALFTLDKNIDFLSLSSMTVTESMPVPDLVGADDRLVVTQNLGRCAEVNYSPCITNGSNNTLLILGDANPVYEGVFVPASERLMAFALAADTSKLVHFALDLAFSGCVSYVVADMPLPSGSIGAAPTSDDVSLSDLVCGAALQALRSSLNPSVDIPQLMQLLAAVPDAEPFMYGHFYEAATRELSEVHRAVYFRGLSGLLLDRQVNGVPPGLLSVLFEDLVRSSCTEDYTKLLCAVDPNNLDLDAAVRICRQIGNLRGLIHLYVVMGQAALGLDAVDLIVAVEFVVEALKMGTYSSQDQDSLILWINERLPLLLSGPHSDIITQSIWASLVTQVIQLSMTHSSTYRLRIYEHLRAIQSESIAAIHYGTKSNNADKLRALNAFASTLIIHALKAHPMDLSLGSAEYFMYLNELITTFDKRRTAEHGPNSSDTSVILYIEKASAPWVCWPPRNLIEEAVIYLITVLTLSSDQLADLATQCENCGWWSVCEHMARRTHDVPRILKCLVMNPDQDRHLFTCFAREIAPLSESMDSDPFKTSVHWDEALVTDVSQCILSLLIPLCHIDTERTASLIASHANPLLLAAHSSLENTPYQAKFRVALTELDPSPISGPLLRTCLLDQADLGPVDGDMAANSFVKRHLTIAKASDIDDWIQICQSHQFVYTESFLWETLGRYDEALSTLLKASVSRQGINYCLLAVDLCRRIGREAHWVKLVQGLLGQLTTTHNFDDLEPIFHEALLGMRAIPQVLAQLIVTSPSNRDVMSPDLIRVFQMALATHQTHFGFNKALERIVHRDLAKEAMHIVLSHLDGFAIPHTADPQVTVPCTVCGLPMQYSGKVEPFQNPIQCAWPCGHVVHAQCIQSNQSSMRQCAVCNPARHAHQHMKEVMGKTPMSSSGSIPIDFANDPHKLELLSNGGQLLPSSTRPNSGEMLASGHIPEFYRPQRVQWFSLLSGMIHQLDKEEDPY